jgi:hypothetical protein
MSAIRWVVSLAISLSSAGCGLHVPEIQENSAATPSERSAFIQAIVRNVRCEVQDAVVRLYAENGEIDPLNRNLGWFDSWGAQISLTLTTDEKGSLNPVVNLLPKTPLTSAFNLNLGATLSAEAQRVNKIGSFFAVSELKDLQACPAASRNRGPFILEGDLKLYQWLKDTMISIDNGDTPAPANEKGPFKSNVLSHEVKFDIISTGTLTPGWKFATSTLNQTGTFLSGTRDRTQDLIVTFGPPDPLWSTVVIDPKTRKAKIDLTTNRPMLRPFALSPAASGTALASEIGNAVNNGFRSALRP